MLLVTHAHTAVLSALAPAPLPVREPRVLQWEPPGPTVVQRGLTARRPDGVSPVAWSSYVRQVMLSFGALTGHDWREMGYICSALWLPWTLPVARGELTYDDTAALRLKARPHFDAMRARLFHRDFQTIERSAAAPAPSAAAAAGATSASAGAGRAPSPLGAIDEEMAGISSSASPARAQSRASGAPSPLPYAPVPLRRTASPSPGLGSPYSSSQAAFAAGRVIEGASSSSSSSSSAGASQALQPSSSPSAGGAPLAAGAAAAPRGPLLRRDRDVLTELPHKAKLLLLAAFCASNNPPDTDSTFFSRRKTGRRRDNSRGAGARSKRRASHMLAGPRPFPLERLLPIFRALCFGADEVTDSRSDGDLLSQLANLRSLHLLSLASGPDELHAPKYRCELHGDAAAAVAATLELDLGKYLFDPTA